MLYTICAASGLCTARAQQPPNVVLIMTDDQGYGDIHAHGNKALDTPVLDRLREEGARFERFYVSPLCAPTRAGLLTGRYYPRTGVSGVSPEYMATMRLEEVTLAEALRGAGYATALIGKWHLGYHYPYLPNRQGFDEFYGMRGGNIGEYFDPVLEDNLEPVETRGYITDILTDRAIHFMEEHRGGPFFLYLAYNAPHLPFMVPDRYFKKYKGRGFDDMTAAIYGMVENIDDNLGRLFRRMDELGLSDNTIVLFLTDNGINSPRYNAGMRGIKGSADEGGTRVPLFIRWPARIAPGTVVSELAGHIDILPTVLDLCGVKAETPPLDGRSLVPLLEGRPGGWPERSIFTLLMWKYDLQPVDFLRGAVRTSRWRYVLNRTRQALYDMRADPGQEHDLSTREPGVTDRLRRDFLKWYRDVTKAGFKRPPIEVGHPEAPEVDLTAAEAFLHGGITAKGKVPWDYRWIRNWKKTEDYAWWDIKVVRAGRYEVIMDYLCPREEAGSRIAVEAGDARIEGTVAYNPIPGSDKLSPHHRVSSWTGEIKDRCRMTLGTLDLPEGRTRLYLRALSREGDEVFKLGSVRLRRIEDN